MDIFVLDNKLTRVRTVASGSECLTAIEDLELGKAGQLTLSLPTSYVDTVKEMNILAIHDRDNRYRLYVVTNITFNNYTMDVTAISYPNYFLSRVGYVEDLRPSDRSLSVLIPQILEGSNWTLNYVDNNLPKYTGSFYYLSKLEALSQISEDLACEFDFYVTILGNKITGQFVDVVEMLGEDTNQRFEYGTNALEVVAEYDSTEVYTRALGRGKGEDVGDGYGRRIEFTDVVWSTSKGDPVNKPKGQKYVDDPYQNYQLPGNERPMKIVEFEEITDTEELLKETYKWLINNNRPKVQFKSKVVETGNFNLGDRVQIIRPDLNIRYETRIFKVTRNLLNENLTELEFGDNIASTPMDKLNSLTTQVDSTNQTVQRVEQQVSMVDANGVRVNYGPNEPSVKKKGDIWYKENEDGTTTLLRFNGEVWERVIDESIIDDIEKTVEDAKAEAEQAKTDADSAREEASNAIDKVTQVELDFNTEISNVKGDITNIDTSLGGMKVDIANANNNATQALVTSQGLQTQVSAGGNIWLTPDFETGKLSDYTYVSDSDATCKIVQNGVTNSKNGSVKYNEPYMRRNPSSKAIRFEGKTTGNNDCFQKSDFNIDVTPGDVFDVGYDFLKTSEGSAGAGFKLILPDGSTGGWIALYAFEENGGNWWHIDGQITVPNDKNYVKAQPFISYGKVSSSGQYCYMDNISIIRSSGSQKSQYTKVTQTAEGLKTEINSQGQQINTVTQTANTALTNIQNLEDKTNTKFAQTDTMLALQAQQIGPSYPNGYFTDKTYKNWYTGNGSITTDSTLKVATDGTTKGYAFLTDYIQVEGDQPMYLKFDGTFSSEEIRNSCKMHVYEYDSSKTNTRNASDFIFKNSEKPLTWSSVEKTWKFGTAPKYVRIEWVVFNGAGSGDMSIKNITLRNGVDNLTGQISVLNNDVNLSVKKNDVISQINISTEGILIDGSKVHITGQTYIDNAVIKNSMIDSLSASKLTAGTIDASKINVINLNAANLTGVNSQFVQSSWNNINSNVQINSNGLRIKKSNGESLLLTNGTLQWRDTNDKEIFGVSRFEDGNVNLAIGTSETMSITYDGDVDDNEYFKSMSFNGKTGLITFDTNRVRFQDRELLFTTMDWGNGRTPSFRNPENTTGIGFGASSLYFGDDKGILSLNDIRTGKFSNLSANGRSIYLRTNNFGTGSVFCLSGTDNAVNIGFGGSTLWFGDSQGAVSLNSILHACGLR